MRVEIIAFREPPPQRIHPLVQRLVAAGRAGPDAGATQATLAALLHLERLRDWETRTRTATRNLSGRTPPALIAALAAWPMLSAPMGEAMTGASRAAVQRNLDTLTTRGLIREVTGAGRFRVWTARM